MIHDIKQSLRLLWILVILHIVGHCTVSLAHILHNRKMDKIESRLNPKFTQNDTVTIYPKLTNKHTPLSKSDSTKIVLYRGETFTITNYTMDSVRISISYISFDNEN